MTILKTDTVSGIGTEGTVFEGDITFDSLNYMTLPKGTTAQSNRGRIVWAGGTDGANQKYIQYVQAQSQGNAEDFGSLSSINAGPGAVASSTRACFGGGSNHPSYNWNTIEYVTIATTSNTTDFGDMATSRMNMSGGGCSSNTRGLFAGGVNLPSVTGYNLIDFITIATTGNSQDFGDLTVGGQGVGASSNSLRGVFGGRTNPSKQNVIDYVDIATTGNASDFGDMTSIIANPNGTSDSHGGLSE